MKLVNIHKLKFKCMKTLKNMKALAWITIAVVLFVSVYFVFQMKENARMETNLDEYMPRTHPAFVYSDMAEDWFNIKDGILIAIENKQGIYNPQTLEKIRNITEALEDMPEFDSNDVMSLYSADNITGTEWGLDVRSFYRRVPTAPENLESLRQQVRANDMVYRRLVSEDETVALIIAGLHNDAFTQEFYSDIMAFAQGFASEEETIYVAGRPIVEGTMALLGPADMKRMVPIVLAVIALVLYFLLGSFRASGATLFSVFVSSIWAFGMMAVLGVPIYSVSTMIPVMLIAIGVAYGIYFFNHLNRYFQKNPCGNVYEAIKYTLKVLWKPLSMAAATTMIGFVSLLSSQVYPIKYFGVFTAFGIFVAYLLAIAFLPAAVVLLGYKPRQKTQTEDPAQKVPWLNQWADLLLRNKPIVYISVALVLLVSLWGIQKVWINSSFLSNFEKDSDIVLTDRFVNSKFGGTSTLNVILESKNADAFKQPEILRLVDAMQLETVKLERTGNSFSLADYLKRMNKVMNEDQEEYYTIPSSSDLVAQYLLLYEMSGDPQNLLKVVNYDYNRINVTFQLKGDDSKTINESLDVIETFREPFSHHDVEINYAGSGYKALVFIGLILDGQILSIVISILLVLVLLSMMFRSIKAGLIGAVPIMLTALISFGVMGLLGIPLSTTTALLSSIAIGIGIDYAIHFLQNYRMHLQTGLGNSEAIYATMTGTGKAILFNAIVVISGFLVLLFSVFPPNRTLGALVSMNMFTSLLGTLSIMMLLVVVFRLFEKKKQGEEKNLKPLKTSVMYNIKNLLT
jgi:uncharacterized protein